MAKHLSMWQICIGLTILGRARNGITLTLTIATECGWKNDGKKKQKQIFNK